ncbi:MAG TPA: sulfite exporter TauE/SafE family protein [Spirochaetales bacterium]|nr:sulfite exporter TauE/SafE family protein [Spirochaetales bacterium]
MNFDFLLSFGFEPCFPFPVFMGLAVLLGFSIGILTGLFGVGGGFLMVPLLNILLGVPYSIAVGTSLCFIIGTSAIALPGHIRQGNFESKTALYISIGSILGSLFGDVLQDILIHTVAKGDTVIFGYWMHGFFIFLLLLTGALLISPFGTPRPDSPIKPLIQRIAIPPFARVEGSESARMSIPGLAGIGFLVGMLTGLLGVGGGVLMMPLLLVVVGLSPKLAVGTSLGIVLAGSIAGVVKKLFSSMPKISLPLTLALLVGSFMGVRVGIWICRLIKGEKIRKYFVYVILLALGVILWDLVF